MVPVSWHGDAQPKVAVSRATVVRHLELVPIGLTRLAEGRETRGEPRRGEYSGAPGDRRGPLYAETFVLTLFIQVSPRPGVGIRPVRLIGRCRMRSGKRSFTSAAAVIR